MELINNDEWKKKHGSKADALFAEIAVLGGFGEIGPAETQLSPSVALDLRGVLDPENKAVSEAAKTRIKAILGGDKAAEEKK